MTFGSLVESVTIVVGRLASCGRSTNVYMFWLRFEVATGGCYNKFGINRRALYTSGLSAV